MNVSGNSYKTKLGDIIFEISCVLYRLQSKGIWGNFIYGIFKKSLSFVNASLMPVMNAEMYKKLTDRVEIKNITINRVGVTSNIIMIWKPETPAFTYKHIPDLRLKYFSDVCIQGNSDIVVDKKFEYVISEEAVGIGENQMIIDGLAYRTNEQFCLLRSNFQKINYQYKRGIMISGKFCDNYYHVLYENFMKLLYLDKVNIPNNIPLIIDKKTMSIPSFKMICEILTKSSQRTIITIESNIIYHFDALYCIDHINKIPSHSRNPHKPSVAIYSQYDMLLLRNELLKEKSTSIFPKRIFITRANTKRRHFNENEIFNVLKEIGFEKIAPENYSILDQMSLFNGAECIVAGSGAALTNLIFVNEACSIICFGRSCKEEICDIPIFNTIANINGAKFYYFPRKNKVSSNIHSDFEIDCTLLKEEVEKILSN